MLLLAILLPGFPPSRLSAWQCPDGTPPPCNRRPARAGQPAPPPIDPSRIAILPFRVTTADTMLGEGVAELLSAEFTGESGPRAVHMGTVLRAWRAAGGRPSAPLPPEDAIRAARSMGAGVVVDGRIVGLGQRLTVSASVLRVPDGRARRATPVSGFADSLDVLLRRFTTNLLATAGGESRATERGVLTESAPAMRAYLQGLAAWRRYQVRPAATAFERAFAEDSTFARAAFMRHVVSNWGAPSPRRWDRLTWDLRERLSASDRILLIAYLGERFPTPRAPSQSLQDKERAAEQLLESPEAQYVLGDWLFHYGAAADAPTAMTRAVRQFQRSLALDSQETVLAHLAEAAVLAGDSAAVRSLRPALENASGTTWGSAWLAAAWLGDNAWLDRLRRQSNVAASFALTMLVPAGAPAALAEEALVLVERAGAPSALASARFTNAVFLGRPSAARALVESGAVVDGGSMVLAGLFADGDTVLEARVIERYLARPASDSATQAGALCLVGLRQVMRGLPLSVDSAFARRNNSECLVYLELEALRRAGVRDLTSRLVPLDSIARAHINLFYFGSSGVESVLLAWGWEAAGDLRRALAAVRMRPYGISLVFAEPTLAREEGRLAALAGDTAGAVAAYRRYLAMRHDPEPALIPQRDSVRAAMARLVRN